MKTSFIARLVICGTIGAFSETLLNTIKEGNITSLTLTGIMVGIFCVGCILGEVSKVLDGTNKTQYTDKNIK